MNGCSVCGSNTTMLSGISKKNGKPWTGFKCQDQSCGNMDFQKSNQNISSQIIPAKSKISNEPEILKLLLDILRKQDEIKNMLEIRNQIFKGSKLETIKPREEEF